MLTEIFYLQKLTQNDQARLQQKLLQGAVGVYPTDTIYGLGGGADLPGVVDKIYEAKSRPPSKQFILLSTRTAHFEAFIEALPRTARTLIAKFWPGPLTILYQDVAVRIADHPVVDMLCSMIDAPIFSTSANLSGQSYKPDPHEILFTFKSRVDFILLDGHLPPRKPSTIVSFEKDGAYTIEREGEISSAQIRQAFQFV